MVVKEVGDAKQLSFDATDTPLPPRRKGNWWRPHKRPTPPPLPRNDADSRPVKTIRTAPNSVRRGPVFFQLVRKPSDARARPSIGRWPNKRNRFSDGVLQLVRKPSDARAAPSIGRWPKKRNRVFGRGLTTCPQTL